MSAAVVGMTGVAPSNTLATLDRLLREPAETLSRIDRGENATAFARAMIATIASTAAVAGAAMGANRPGLQVLFAAVKLPLDVLLTAAICAPALTAVNAALDRRADARRDLALVLASLALGTTVLAALSPVILLAVLFDAGYHWLALVVVGCCAVAGAVGVSFLVRGIARERGGRVPVALALLAVYGLVGSQMTWTLRPWLLRPRTPGVPFVRSLEGSLWESVRESLRSVQGIYRESMEDEDGGGDAPDVDPQRSSDVPSPRRGSTVLL